MQIIPNCAAARVSELDPVGAPNGGYACESSGFSMRLSIGLPPSALRHVRTCPLGQVRRLADRCRPPWQGETCQPPLTGELAATASRVAR